MTSPCACASTVRRCSWAAGPTPLFVAHGARTSTMSIRVVRSPREKQTNEGTVASIGHQYDCDLPTPTIQMEIVYNVGSHDVYSSHLQIKTAQTTILGGLRCFGIQNDS